MGKQTLDDLREEISSLNDRQMTNCFVILAFGLIISICLPTSLVAIYRNTYIANHQDDLIALLTAMNVSFSVHPAQQYVPSVYDTMTDTELSSVSSYAISEPMDFFVNGSFVLPPNAIKKSKNTYFLGEKMVDMKKYRNKKRGISLEDEFENPDPELTRVQVMAHIHWEHEEYEYVTNEATTCYSFNAIGAYWKKREDYILTTTNTEGLSDSFVDSTFKTSVSTWLQNIPNHQVIGDRLDMVSNGVNSNEPDGYNELVFAPISTAGVIAVTITYGTFSGSVASREIIEWDMVLNQRDYNFGDASSSSSKMDLASIMTHELGHVLGLADQYSSSCSHVTMYGYSSEGQTFKRTLAQEDKTGIKVLYGEAVAALPTSSSTGNRPHAAENITSKTSFCLMLIVFSLFFSMQY